MDYRGGADGIAHRSYDPLTRKHPDPAPALDVVALDGPARRQDPRVGMVGGSYGGQLQYAAAAVTPKLDTIVPILTWHDLSYSLGPNGTDQGRGPASAPPGVSTRTPGAVKLNWALGFAALGALGDLQNQTPNDPLRTRGPNFAAFVCAALVYGAVTGALDPATVGHLRAASVSSYADRVRIPTGRRSRQSARLR